MWLGVHSTMHLMHPNLRSRNYYVLMHPCCYPYNVYAHLVVRAAIHTSHMLCVCVCVCRFFTSWSQSVVQCGITSAPRNSVLPVNLVSSFKCWISQTAAAARLVTSWGRFVLCVRRRLLACYWTGRMMGRKLTWPNSYRVGTDLF